jgi:hypothetical protein
MPHLREAFPTHRAYALATVREILGEHFASARVLSATCFDTTLFLNRDGHFEVKPLPLEAQVSPAFGICVGDFNGDRHEDVFLSQNLFAVHREDSPYASGQGLMLSGNGQGSFQPVPASESGIRIPGEQRGCAAADYDQDGRVDLAVTQNSGATRLFRNRGAVPGLRVRLRGPVGNRHGVGAVIRIDYGSEWGPAREIHAGSGYLSQDSSIQVFGHPALARHVWVRWPGGATNQVSLPESVLEVTVDFDRSTVASP